ncbi:hypothetical protein MKEN_00627400 [Mycena kentingensis (nom. inval.)]|nr:hypothetical protein MKEN_00627400 [Mycena kentingensis (nom. inval.)]
MRGPAFPPALDALPGSIQMPNELNHGQPVANAQAKTTEANTADGLDLQRVDSTIRLLRGDCDTASVAPPAYRTVADSPDSSSVPTLASAARARRALIWLLSFSVLFLFAALSVAIMRAVLAPSSPEIAVLVVAALAVVSVVVCAVMCVSPQQVKGMILSLLNVHAPRSLATTARARTRPSKRRIITETSFLALLSLVWLGGALPFSIVGFTSECLTDECSMESAYLALTGVSGLFLLVTAIVSGATLKVGSA